MKQLLIVGAGGFGREVYAWAKTHPDCGKVWELAGFLDDNPAALDGYDYPVSVIGPIKGYVPAADQCFVCAIGAPVIKREVCERLLAQSAEFIALVHPSAIVGENVQLGRGSVICPRVTLTCDIEIGVFVAVNCHSSVGHDARIGDWTTISGHCDLTGFTQVGKEVLIGSGASVLPSKSVGDGALVGAGAVVIRSVAAGQKVFGNPARRFD